MSAIQGCLSVFAVAAGSNNPKALTSVDRAIVDYLATLDSASQLEALKGLREAYSAMKLDSRIAIAIRQQLDDRIALLEVVTGGPPANPEAEPPLASA